MTEHKGLVLGHLENISSRIFETHSKELASFADGKHGVYALYKGKRLYYVGLAANLKRRVNHHLKDKHSGKWDSFSLYLVRKSSHIKELESLILRIADPKGNSVKGRLPGSDNLKKGLRQKIKTSLERELADLLGPVPNRASKKPQKTTKKKSSTSKTSRKEPALAPYTKKSFFLKRIYKGKEFKASVLKNGQIRMDGEIYNSPSLAAKAVIKRNANGWTFWKYKNAEGNWVPLNELRS